MLTRLWRKLYGNAVIATTLRGQRSLPYLARPQLEERRDQAVRETVLYAARHVPFYRNWFAETGIDPATIRGAADLSRLPVLDKRRVRGEPNLFIAETAAARSGLAFSTSGTTGTPIEIRHDRRSVLANFAFGERERAPVIDLCGGAFRPSELYVGYQTSTFKKVQAFYAESTLLPVRPQRSFVSLSEPIDKIVAIANLERPDVLVGYGGWIDLFFKTVAARGLEVHLPKLVMYMGEALPHGTGEFIEARFGVPVLSRYNAVESFKIGFYCEQRSGFHLHEDLCHVRIIGADGRDVAPGELGEVLISNLVNRATVLLNYPMGDMGRLTDEVCGCGRSLRRLSELEGRVEDILPLRDGRFIHPRSIWEVLKSDVEVLQYQLTQTEPQRFVLTLATIDDAAFERARARALPALAGLLAPDPIIEVQSRREIDREAGGKFRVVASLSKPPATPIAG